MGVVQAENSEQMAYFLSALFCVEFIKSSVNSQFYSIISSIPNLEPSTLSMVSSTMMRVYGSSVFSSLTIMTWDFLGHIPEDVRLLQGYRVTLPLIVYLIARISTLAFLLSAIEDGPRLTGGIILARTDALLLIQRGSTSILLYLRVHALYQSNLYVKILFWICLLGVTASCVLKDSMSGICSGIFDVFVFCAIFWKLGWYPDTRVIGGRQQVCWKFRIPFRRKPDHTLTDRILQDSLYYLLVAIALKIFQIPFLVPPLSAVKHPRYLGWYTLTFILDAVLVCIISSKIFRDMKLGLPGLHLETSTTDETSPISGLYFATVGHLSTLPSPRLQDMA